MTKNLKETASAGAVGTASIAVNTGGSVGAKVSWKDFMKKYQAKRLSFKPVKPFPIKISESFELHDVLSRLSGIEGRATDWANSRDNVTYGVEDDEGNIMKVTVRKPQAQEFEVYLAQQLGDMEQSSLAGDTVQTVSMAELLFNLKDKFDIIDVDFPKIPTDVIYNADKATTGGAETNPAAGGAPINNDLVADDQVGGDNIGGPAGGLDDMGGDLGDDLPPVNNKGGDINLDDVEAEDDLSAPGADLLSSGGDAEGGDSLDPEMDADGVTDFVEPASGSDETTILDKVISMLKSQADAEKSKADAEAERYRAEQAESSARAASATIAQEEEIARMELADDRAKEQDKKAKQLADIAKFRAKSGSGLNEADSNETSQMIRRQMSLLPQQWATTPTDSPDQAKYKNTQRINAMRELQARLRMAMTRENEARRLKAAGKSANPDPNIQNAQNQQAAQQQGQQQGPQGNPGVM